MKLTKHLMALAGAALLAMWIGGSGPRPVASLVPVAAASDHDRAIERAFEDVLDREPTEGERHRYRELMEDEYWTERDIREDLRDRAEARRERGRRQDPEKVIRRAYEDILDREPDREGLRLYRSRMIDDDWSEEDVRDALRKSPEYASHRKERAETIVRRAYEDVLGREPDQKGLVSYRARVMNEDWDERDVRRDLERSAEYRKKDEVSEEEAKEIVRRVYLDVLAREPDAGSRGYIDKIRRERWTAEDVARELRKSPEYRSRQE